MLENNKKNIRRAKLAVVTRARDRSRKLLRLAYMTSSGWLAGLSRLEAAYSGLMKQAHAECIQKPIKTFTAYRYKSERHIRAQRPRSGKNLVGKCFQTHITTRTVG